jgi:hypothetical protein
MPSQDDVWLCGILNDVDKFMSESDAPPEIKTKWRAVYNTALLLQQSANMMHSELGREEDKYFHLVQDYTALEKRMDTVMAILADNAHVWQDEDE